MTGRASDIETTHLRKSETMWRGAITAMAQRVGGRESQQDAIYADGDAVFVEGRFSATLGVLCDGMGGLADGGLAGAAAVEGFRAAFEAFKASASAAASESASAASVAASPAGFSFSDADMRAFLDGTVRKLSRDIYLAGKRVGSDVGSGSTIVAAALVNGRAWWVSAGDSRAYVYRGGRLARLTRDHTYALLATADPVDARPPKAGDHNADALVSYLGMENIAIVDVCETPLSLMNGDIIMLCSDGIYKALADGALESKMTEFLGSLGDMARGLADAAVAESPRPADNASVVLMRFMHV